MRLLIQGLDALFQTITITLRRFTEVETEYLANIARQNRLVMMVATLLCLLIEIPNCLFVLTYGQGLTTLNNRIYFTYYLLMILIPLVACGIQYRREQRGADLYSLHLSAAVFYLGWNLCFNSYQIDQGHQSTSIVFLTALVTVAVLMRLRLRHSLSLTAVAYLLFLSLNYSQVKGSDITNLTISTSVALMATLVLYLHEINTQWSQKQLLIANQALEAEEDHLRISLEKHNILMAETNLLSFDWDVAGNQLHLSHHCAQQLDWPTLIPAPLEWLVRATEIHPEDRIKLV